MRTKLIPILAAALLLFLPSCLFGSEKNSKHTGNYVSQETLNKIEAGAEREYVLGLIGEPTTKVNLADGGQIWKWQYKIVSTSKGWVVFILSKESTETSSGTAYVEFDPDGKVTKTWRE